jgi:type VI secretion system protein ImpM
MTQPSGPLAYYGKLPARGDFIGRRLPRETVAQWDDWLQQGLAESRQALGAAWLDLYLTAPLWRFVLPAGLCGPSPLAGVLMPSVDKVGRTFPMMLALELALDDEPAAVAQGSSAWFEAIEHLALAALADDFSLDRLDLPVAAPTAVAVRPPTVARAAVEETAFGVCTGLPDLASAGIVASRILSGSDESLWWTAGSERIYPALVAARGLPAPHGYAAFIDGDWARHGWSMIEAGADRVEAAARSAASFATGAELLPWDREE